MNRYGNILREAGAEVNPIAFSRLSEAAQAVVTDETLMKMFKFITDKYNSLDFGEIEKSAGDIARFKYREIILENVDILNQIYTGSTDQGASKYLEVTKAVTEVMEYLMQHRVQFSTLYKSGNGVIQLLYVSMVSGCIYSVGTLISNTIRFVTVEQDVDCQVLFDEIPGTIKHIHIKNILAVSKDLPTITALLNELSKAGNKVSVNESITVSGVTIAVLATIGVVMLIPRIITLIREIIYSIYYSRIKRAEMLDVQIQLIKTNIESLESGRGNKKVIARQKKIAQSLERWKDRIAVKMDSTEVAVKQQKQKEQRELKVDENSPIVQASYQMDAASNTDALML